MEKWGRRDAPPSVVKQDKMRSQAHLILDLMDFVLDFHKKRPEYFRYFLLVKLHVFLHPQWNKTAVQFNCQSTQPRKFPAGTGN